MTLNATTNLMVSRCTSTSIKKSQKQIQHLPNRSEERKIKNNGETRVGLVILVYVGLTEFLNYRNVWVVCHISETRITFKVFAGPTRKEPPKPRLMTMEEVDSDYDPNEDK